MKEFIKNYKFLNKNKFVFFGITALILIIIVTIVITLTSTLKNNSKINVDTDNSSTEIKSINNYLYLSVSKEDVKDAIYIYNSQWEIDITKFKEEFLDTFFTYLNKNKKYDFDNLQFDFFNPNNNDLSEIVNIKYWITDDYEKSISSQCQITYLWSAPKSI